MVRLDLDVNISAETPLFNAFLSIPMLRHLVATLYDVTVSLPEQFLTGYSLLEGSGNRSLLN